MPIDQFYELFVDVYLKKKNLRLLLQITEEERNAMQRYWDTTGKDKFENLAKHETADGDKKTLESIVSDFIKKQDKEKKLAAARLKNTTEKKEIKSVKDPLDQWPHFKEVVEASDPTHTALRRLALIAGNKKPKAPAHNHPSKPPKPGIT